MQYFIGDATMTGNLYGFEQDMACGYTETITVTGLPAFVTHNEAAKDFTIPQTSDLSLIGVYTVTIRSEISVPDDYT